MNTVQTQGQARRVARALLLMGVLTAVMLVIAVACRGDESDDNTSPGIDRTPVMQTFTPTSEADATARAEFQQTVEAAREATQTWVAENPPPPPPTRDPNAEPEEEGMRPPYAFLFYGDEEMEGVFGNYSWVDMETGSYGTVLAPFYDVGDFGLTVAGGGELQFALELAALTPTSMTGSPIMYEVEIYTWEGNNAIPTGQDGSVAAHPWFVPGMIPPVLTQPMHPEQTVFTMPAAADRYVVRIRAIWPTGNLEENPPQQEIFAVYAFTVYVR